MDGEQVKIDIRTIILLICVGAGMTTGAFAIFSTNKDNLTLEKRVDRLDGRLNVIQIGVQSILLKMKN